ncbi:MAG: DNA repair protein RecO [Prevotellaceae bacterium]|nr:DNA repair protein RecO [Prevotellaceae bacterium]
MLAKEKGIVLHSFRYGDDGQIVSVFFAREGIVSFLTKSMKGRRNNNIRYMLQPLSVVDVAFDFRANRQLQYFKEMKPSVLLADIYENPLKITIVIFLAEVLRYVLKGERENEEIFAFIERSILWLEQSEADFSSFHIVFLANLLRYLGYDPAFDDEYSAVTDEIKRLMALDYESMNLHLTNHSDRNDKVEDLLTYYRRHLPEFPQLKSLEVLKEVFRA